MFGYQGETENAARQTAQLTTQYQEITRQFPAAPTSAENLQARRWRSRRSCARPSRTPDTVMALVSRALEASPNIVVREFGWKYGATEISAERSAAAPAGAAAAPAPLALPGSPAPAAARKQSALIDGEIRPFRGDYRAAIATINDFAARLGKDPRWPRCGSSSCRST